MDQEDTGRVCFSLNGRQENYLLLLDRKVHIFMGDYLRIAGDLACKQYVASLV